MSLRLLPLLLGLSTLATGVSACAQGTHQWSESSFNDWEKGTPQGVAISSDGSLSAGFAVTPVGQLEAADVWAATSDAEGNAYLATGSPAQVVRIAPDGKQTVVFSTKDVSVQALTVGADGALYAATLPSAKVYRLDPHAGKALDDATAPVIFDAAQTEGRPKYIWAMQFDRQGRLYLAAGAPGGIYRVGSAALEGKPGTPAQKPELFFTTDEPHIRSMLFAPDGDLIAGSDGTGLVYRIHPDGKGFVLFEAQKREITALALGSGGQLYLAAVGEKGRVAALPALPAGGAAAAGGSITVTVVQPGSQQSVNTNALIPDGSEVYLLPATADQAPRRIWAAHDDIVYSLRSTPDGLLAATGNRGRIYRVHEDGTFEDVAHAGAGQVIGFAAAPGDALYLPAANTGRLLRMSLSPAAGGTLLSDVFDATLPSQWGRAELTATGAPKLEAHTGNIDNPARGWSDWHVVRPDEATLGQPAARFVQWRLTLTPAAHVQQLSLNYLPANAAPEVDEVLVVPGTRANAQANQPSYPAQTTLTFASQGGNAVNIDNNSPAAPLTAYRDKGSVTARWAAHDDNGDELRFALYYRGATDRDWRLLKDNLSDRFYSFDATLLPDGPYRLRVVATDAPSHPADAALTAERISDLFLIDTATPQVTALVARQRGASLHLTATVTDQHTPIARAEYSLDAGPWQYIEPVGRLSDALTEQYDLQVPAAAGAHTLTLRAFDRYDNVGSAKTQTP